MRREGAEEILAQFPEVGDRQTQAALDGWVDQVADLLREIDATASDLADRLRIAALNAGVGPGPSVRPRTGPASASAPRSTSTSTPPRLGLGGGIPVTGTVGGDPASCSQLGGNAPTTRHPAA